MQNEQKSPSLSQPDNKPMSYGGGVSPMGNKAAGHTPSPTGKSSAPWQAGHGTGQATDAGKPEKTGEANLG